MVDSPAASSPANEHNSVESQTGNGEGQEMSLDSIFAGLELRSEADLDTTEAEASQAAGTVAPQTDPSANAAETTPAQNAAPAANPAETTPASTDADWDPSLPFHAHPRWKDKVAAEKRAREELAAVRAEAEAYRQALGGRKPEDVAVMARLQAALESPDPEQAEEAYRVLQSIQERLAPIAKSAKPRLPADLAEKVEAGLISEEVAEEVVRTKAMLEARERQLQQIAAQQTAAQQQAFDQSITHAIRAERETWKAEQDYEAKLPVIAAELDKLVATFGRPKDATVAAQMAKMAKHIVDGLPEFQRPAQAPAPKKTPVQPLTDGGVSTRQAPPAASNDPFAGLGIRFV